LGSKVYVTKKSEIFQTLCKEGLKWGLILEALDPANVLKSSCGCPFAFLILWFLRVFVKKQPGKMNMKGRIYVSW